MTQAARNHVLYLLFVSVVFGQNWEVTLTSDEVIENVSLKELKGNFLVLTHYSSSGNTSTLIDVKDIKEIRHIGKRKVTPRIKKRLIVGAAGAAAGYCAGWVFSNAVLWWLSNEEMSGFSLRWTSSKDEGDRLLVKTITQMSVVIGALQGYNWGVHLVENIAVYNLSQMTPEEKVHTIQDILHPPTDAFVSRFLNRIRSAIRGFLHFR